MPTEDLRLASFIRKMGLRCLFGNFERVGAGDLRRVKTRLEVPNVIVSYFVIVFCKSFLSRQVFVSPSSTPAVLRVENKLASDSERFCHFLI